MAENDFLLQSMQAAPGPTGVNPINATAAPVSPVPQPTSGSGSKASNPLAGKDFEQIQNFMFRRLARRGGLPAMNSLFDIIRSRGEIDHGATNFALGDLQRNTEARTQQALGGFADLGFNTPLAQSQVAAIGAGGDEGRARLLVDLEERKQERMRNDLMMLFNILTGQGGGVRNDRQFDRQADLAEDAARQQFITQLIGGAGGLATGVGSFFPPSPAAGS